MIAAIQITDKRQAFTYLVLTDHWYELKNFWRINDGYGHKLKFGNGEYERVPAYCLYLYGHDRDGSLVRVVRLDIKALKYPFEKGYRGTGLIYKEAALEAEAGDMEYEVIGVY
jgi:hypothetical protein